MNTVRASLAWGQKSLDLEIREANLLVGRRAPIASALPDPVAAMREALEHPLDFPALRLALTPDDHVAIFVDEGIPRLVELLIPLFEHLQQAHIQPEAITLICAPPSTGQPWLDDLPDDFQDVHIEVHQPEDRKKLACLATTQHDRRVYLNRTAVEAEQLVLLTRRRYDPHFGYSGAETSLFPLLADPEAIAEASARFAIGMPGTEPSRIQREAREIAWLLGAPFFVQVIEGEADAITHILAGPTESSDEGQRLLDARFRVTFDRAADVVIAGITGDPARLTCDDLARAFRSAARVFRVESGPAATVSSPEHGWRLVSPTMFSLKCGGDMPETLEVVQGSFLKIVRGFFARAARSSAEIADRNRNFFAGTRLNRIAKEGVDGPFRNPGRVKSKKTFAPS